MGHLCGTPSLQGAAGILLDEPLVAGVADALGVDAGWQGQLVHRAGFTEGAPTVLADVLSLAPAGLLLAELADLGVPRP